MLKHTGEFGNDCVACHDGADRMANFEHSQTAFPLEGKHAETACADCHPEQSAAASGLDRFSQAVAECTSCHETGHPGLFEEPCEKCHNSNAWSPADWNGRPFEHASSGFSLAKHELDAQGGALACTDCHGADVNQDVLPACRDCHAQGADGAAFIANHEEQFGPACLDCHDGVDRMSNFDHDRFFVLDGRHADLECQECHADRVFNGTPVAVRRVSRRAANS